MCAMAHRLRQRRAPACHSQRIQLTHRQRPEGVLRLHQVVAQPIATGRRPLVLLQEGVDELAQRDVGSVQRPEARLAQLVVEDLLAAAQAGGNELPGVAAVAEGEKYSLPRTQGPLRDRNRWGQRAT
jgi:hypothetical protein